MNLIFIYGPPAVGKYTIAKNLSRITGYKLFHNQLTIDLLLSVFDFGSRAFAELNRNIRLDIFRAACQEGIEGIIFTYCYVFPRDVFFLEDIMEILNENSGKIFFVQLTCDKSLLFKRVKNKSRKKYKKITSVNHLKKLFRRVDFFKTVPDQENLVIDTKVTNARNAAEIIAKHYNLTIRS